MSLRAAIEELEPQAHRLVLRLVLLVVLTVATPFVALAFVAAWLRWHVLWVLVPGTIAILLLAGGLVAWAWARWWLRRAARELSRFG